MEYFYYFLSNERLEPLLKQPKYPIIIVILEFNLLQSLWWLTQAFVHFLNEAPKGWQTSRI